MPARRSVLREKNALSLPPRPPHGSIISKICTLMIALTRPCLRSLWIEKPLSPTLRVELPRIRLKNGSYQVLNSDKSFLSSWSQPIKKIPLKKMPLKKKPLKIWSLSMPTRTMISLPNKFLSKSHSINLISCHLCQRFRSPLTLAPTRPVLLTKSILRS